MYVAKHFNNEPGEGKIMDTNIKDAKGVRCSEIQLSHLQLLYPHIFFSYQQRLAQIVWQK